MQVRFATGGAAAGWAEVVRSTSPYLVCSEDSVVHDMATRSGTLARYVVVADGQVLGLARVRTGGPGEVAATLHVHADHQGRGVGGLLLERVLRVAGDRAVTALANGDDRSLEVARHWGFVPQQATRVSSVVPAAAAPPPPTPEGLPVVPLSELPPERVWACHQDIATDDPSGLTPTMGLAEYVETQWAAPLHRPDLGRAVLDGDTVVAFAEVHAASGRAWNSLTGTLRAHRGRGLATLVKAHSLQALAREGITRCSTGNAEANQPMLRVNERLGYRPVATLWTTRREPVS